MERAAALPWGIRRSQRDVRLCVISVIDSDSVPQRSGECAFTVKHVPGDVNADPLMKIDRHGRVELGRPIDRDRPG